MAARRTLIVPSVIADVYRLAASLRPDDAAEITCFGLNPRKALRLNYRDAIFRRTAFIDGEIAAMWGLCGEMLADTGYPYLLTAAPVEKVPLSMVKTARREIAAMLAIRACLEGHVAASYERACRFLVLLGFTLGAPEPVGKTGALFRKFSLRRA